MRRDAVGTVARTDPHFRIGPRPPRLQQQLQHDGPLFFSNRCWPSMNIIQTIRYNAVTSLLQLFNQLPNKLMIARFTEYLDRVMTCHWWNGE
jgi:hypothetical protein